MTLDKDAPAAVRVALVVSALGIAFQVASRATRDALFLSVFDVALLPRMVAAAAVISLLVAAAFGRLMARMGPGRLMPLVFGFSAALVVVEWGLLAVAPGAASVLVFIHVGSIGALLISGFWSLFNERFDPRTAKHFVGRIGTAGTVGGVLGGLLAERVGAMLTMAAMLPMLAVMHAVCALLVRRLRVPVSGAEAVRAAATPGALRTLRGSHYLLLLAALTVLLTASEQLIDWVFKAAATRTFGRGETLLRVFALFYAASNLVGIVMGALLSRVALLRLGLARTVSTLPWTAGAGGVLALALPGFGTALAVRLGEAVMRNSLYRSGWELLFTPLPPPEKRAVKPLLDVGGARVGDILAAGLTQVALLLFAGGAPAALLVCAIACSALSIVLTFRVHRGYVATLERSLLSRAVQLDAAEVRDRTTRSTIAALPAIDEAVLASLEAPRASAFALDPALLRLGELRSADAARVRMALDAGALEPLHVAQAVALLERDDVARDAVEALRGVAQQHVGQLVDALLEPETPFAVRRRLPMVLARVGHPRSVDGLLAGLLDERFEVRFRCGQALSHLALRAPDVPVDAARVYEAVQREVTVDRNVWESQQTHEHDVVDDTPALDDLLKERASRSLEHVFTMLSLVLPREPLQVAFRGLHARDPQLRGTALEYLETSLPETVRVKLWPFLDDDAPRPAARPREQVVGDLLKARASIALSLEEVRKRIDG